MCQNTPVEYATNTRHWECGRMVFEAVREILLLRETARGNANIEWVPHLRRVANYIMCQDRVAFTIECHIPRPRHPARGLQQIESGFRGFGVVGGPVGTSVWLGITIGSVKAEMRCAKIEDAVSGARNWRMYIVSADKTCLGFAPNIGSGTTVTDNYVPGSMIRMGECLNSTLNVANGANEYSIRREQQTRRGTVHTKEENACGWFDLSADQASQRHDHVIGVIGLVQTLFLELYMDTYKWP
ncbi:hypothetical protein DFH09DRAFT_1072356 [Mycena vulgaris]|nr:hypothetical protein DFH09DRAFT_1072356 [Mycena vulgaris]